jgi:hypothetical protein
VCSSDLFYVDAAWPQYRDDKFTFLFAIINVLGFIKLSWEIIVAESPEKK